MKRKYLLAAVPAALLLAALVYFYGGHQPPAGQPRLENLTAANLADVQNAFNAAKDEVRMLILLSPT